MSRSSHGSPSSGASVVDVVDGGGVLVVEVGGGCVLVVEVGGGCVLDVDDGGRLVLDVEDVGAGCVELDDVEAREVVEVVLEPGSPPGVVVTVVLVVEVVVERPGLGRVLDVVLVVGVGVAACVGQLAGTGAARATKRPGSSWRTLPPKKRQ
jgi:hypothetical protein